MKIIQQCFATVVVLTLTTNAALATPVTVDHMDLPGCDTLLVPFDVDELGDAAVFPADEGISSSDSIISTIACPSAPANGLANHLVAITNLTNNSFDNLWYVADPETSFTNVDGLVNGELAFRIDEIGLNQPLLGESISFDGIFEPGETWRFIVDGYSNSLGAAASAFFSPGAVGALSAGNNSSASIIATIAVPEPASILLLAIGLLATIYRRK